MDSNSQKSPRPRYRFGFHGRRKLVSGNVAVGAEATPDDILNSLTRQVAMREGLLAEGERGAEEVYGSEVPDFSRRPQMAPEVRARVGKERGLGRFAFVLILLGGLFLLELYGFLTRTIDLALLNRLIQYSGIQTIFSQPFRVGVIAATALLAGLWIARKRKHSIVRL